MLRGHHVGNRHSYGKIGRNHNGAPVFQRASGGGGSGQGGALLFQLLLEGIGQTGIVSDADSRGQSIVLRLRKHIRSEPCGVGGRIGQHEHFARPGDHINAHNALHHALGSGDKNIARPGNNIHRLNGLRAVGHGRNGPCPANAVNFINIKKMRCGKNMRINRAVLAGRRKYRQARHAGHLGGYGAHEQAGNKGRIATLTAGNIQAASVNRCNLLAENAAVLAGEKPRFLNLSFMERAYVGRSLADDFAAFNGD